MKKFNTKKRTRNCRKYNIISTETKFANITEMNIETQSGVVQVLIKHRKHPFGQQPNPFCLLINFDSKFLPEFYTKKDRCQSIN